MDTVIIGAGFVPYVFVGISISDYKSWVRRLFKRIMQYDLLSFAVVNCANCAII